MNRGFLASREFWTGVLFLAVGMVTLVLASGYPRGSAVQMGPGYFPTVLGVVMVALGAVNTGRAVLAGGGTALRWAPVRSVVLIPASVLAFALLIDRAGLAISVVAVVLLSCLGGARFRAWEAVVSAVVLSAGTSLLFIWFLGIPMFLFPPGW